MTALQFIPALDFVKEVLDMGSHLGYRPSNDQFEKIIICDYEHGHPEDKDYYHINTIVLTNFCGHCKITFNLHVVGNTEDVEIGFRIPEPEYDEIIQYDEEVFKSTICHS